jgi:hypothetical protein
LASFKFGALRRYAAAVLNEHGFLALKRQALFLAPLRGYEAAPFKAISVWCGHIFP